MKYALAISLIALIIALSAYIARRIRVWHHRRWLRNFRETKVFRPIPSHFLDGQRNLKDRFPQDHP